MAEKKTLTFALMDAPYENARSTTALRLISVAAKRGYNINVFAYEGAVLQPFLA
jgi:tRNA 2-thiouridine synthesizing protein D